MSLVSATRTALNSVGGALGGGARWLFAVKVGALASVLFLAWAMVTIARDPETTGLTPSLISVVIVYSVFAGIMVTTVAHFIYPAVGPARSAIRNAHVGQAARASWRVLFLGALEIAAVVAWRNQGVAWQTDVIETWLLAAAVWLGLVIAWPVLDAAVVTAVWRGRHATPTEARAG